MNTLKSYYESKGFEVMPVNFKGWKRKGFDIVRSDGGIVATFEPSQQFCKWKVYAERTNYILRITKKRLGEIELKQYPHTFRVNKP